MIHYKLLMVPMLKVCSVFELYQRVMVTFMVMRDITQKNAVHLPIAEFEYRYLVIIHITYCSVFRQTHKLKGMY